MTETSSTCSSRITRSRTRSALSLRNSRVSEKNLLSISKDSHFKPHFSPNGTLSSRRANRQPRENSLKLRCFPRNLALRSVRFASIRPLAQAQADPTNGRWPKPVRVCVSSRVEQFEPPRRRARWRLRRQAPVREDALDHRRLFDRSDDLQLAATHATLNIKVEHAFEKARPSHASPRVMRMIAIGRVPGCRLRRNARNERRPAS